jgi:hypothetical protein
LRELSSYVFSPMRGGDSPFYRGSSDTLGPVLLAAAKDGSPGSAERLEHEFELRDELDAAWALRPIALSRYNERLALVLEDPGGEPLDRLLDEPLEISAFLRIAIRLADAVRQVHARGMIWLPCTGEAAAPSNDLTPSLPRAQAARIGELLRKPLQRRDLAECLQRVFPA